MTVRGRDTQSTDSDGLVIGLLLAAGEGRRFGQPKALVQDPSGESWLARSANTLRDGGVRLVYVVLGASIEAARHEVPGWCVIVEAADWAEGMGASLRAGLLALEIAPTEVEAALVMLVDTPGVGQDVVARLVSRASPDALARAAYDGHIGHPVLLGRNHWAGARDRASGDEGARRYLREHQVELVECGDIGTGDDVDSPDQLN